jgi:phosphoglycolate phosphatase
MLYGRVMTDAAPLLVFDLDGTLAETVGDLMLTLNHVLGREGVPTLTAAEGRRIVGQGSRALLAAAYAKAGRDLEDEKLERLFRDYLAYYEANIAVESHLFPGVVAALDRFAAAGWRFAVCTNKIAASSVELLKALGVAGRFAAICGQDTFRAHGQAIFKPDPRALLMTIERASGDPRRAVMVGDSKFDIATAKAAGVPVVAVDFGYTDVPARDLGPDRLISHFDELWDAVEGLVAERFAAAGTHASA